MYGFMLYCICSVPHLRVSMWYLILLVASSDYIRGTDVLFLFKCGLAFKMGLRHLSWNNSGSSAILSSIKLYLFHINPSYPKRPSLTLMDPS
jgi:hypothetical protein